MNSDKPLAKAFVAVFDYVLPIPLTVVAFFLWRARSGDSWMGAYSLALGILFGYAIPSLGTMVFGLWEFRGPLLAGKLTLHHGFLYAPYLSLLTLLCFPQPGSIGLGRSVAVAAVNAIAQGFVSTFHDYMGVKAGFIVFHTDGPRMGRSREESVPEFAPLGFALLGAAYSAACLAAEAVFLRPSGKSAGGFCALLALGLAAMSLASTPFLFIEKKRVREAWLGRFGSAGRK
jgi:hypothetical protein